MEYNEYKEFIGIEGLRKQVAISTMTRKEICEKAGISEDVLSALLLRSRNQLTTTENIARLAYALECKVDELVEFKGIKFDERYSMYSRLPKEPEAGLSYQPLWSMMFNEYGPGYKSKFEALFENVRSVSIKNMESDSYDSRSYKRKLNGNYPLTLPAIYEICRTFKCTPGCIFGCKGDYNWEKEFSSNIFTEKEGLDEAMTKKISVILDSNIKVSVFLEKENDKYIYYSDKQNYIKRLKRMLKSDEIWVLYSDEKDFLLFDNIPNMVTVYKLEDIDTNSETPFLVNGEWRKGIRVITYSKEYVKKILTGLYESPIRSTLSIPKGYTKRFDDFCIMTKYIKTSFIPLFEVGCYSKKERQLNLSPYSSLLKKAQQGKIISYFSKFYNNFEKLHDIKYTDLPESYK